jgi:aldehyde:ferredoxin oxidoreductase
MNRWSYGAWSPDLLARLLSAGSGTETSVDDLFDFARKIRTLERAYEAGEGLTREDDTLPRKAFKIANEEGHLLDPEKFELMKSEYYELRGWDPETGVPTEESLVALGLEDIAIARNAKSKSE